MNPPINHDGADGPDDQPEKLVYGTFDEPLKMWLLGVGLAGAIIAYGIYGIMTGHTAFYGGRRYAPSYQLHGPTALFQCIAYIALGAFVHFRWFWGLHRRLAAWGNPLAFTTAAIGICCCLYVGIRVLFYPFETGY